MTLNLPILAQLVDCRSVLIAGMGGGFDIFCGLPIRHELRRAGKTVHLSNLSFTRTEFIKDTITLAPGVTGVTAAGRSVLLYRPELYLARHLRDTEGEELPIWCFSGEVATLPLLQAYRALLDHLKPDALIFIDGGVDSLMQGDEAEVGTILEDAVALTVASQLSEVPLRLLACLGMGAENDVTHTHVLENIAALSASGDFLGTCALTQNMEAYRAYEDAVTFVHSQRGQDASIINTSVLSAVRGAFGNVHATERTQGSRLHISPLMSLYWFFDLPAVAAKSRFVPELLNATTRREALQAIASVRTLLPRRSTSMRFPLP